VRRFYHVIESLEFAFDLTFKSLKWSGRLCLLELLNSCNS
jgi:hypothetical protein